MAAQADVQFSEQSLIGLAFAGLRGDHQTGTCSARLSQFTDRNVFPALAA